MNRKMISRSFGILAVSLFVLLLAGGPVATAFAETVTIRSGQAAIGSPDPTFTYLAGPPVAPLSGSPFTAADFAAALAGPPAIVVPPYGPWIPGLACDPLVKWISTTPTWGPQSTLFAGVFDVRTCCIYKATLTFCWAADDFLGDLAYGGPNHAGVYVNGVPLLPMITGGSYATESTATVDVTAFIHCGANALYVYDRDGAAVVSGAMFSATLEIIECSVSTEESTWSRIKALYR